MKSYLKMTRRLPEIDSLTRKPIYLKGLCLRVICLLNQLFSYIIDHDLRTLFDGLGKD